MRVVFAKPEDMLHELKEVRMIHEVRIESLFDQQYVKGLAVLRLYVSIEALLDRKIPLYASYEKVTYKGFKPMVDTEAEKLFVENDKEMERMREKLSAEGFTVLCGHFVE